MSEMTPRVAPGYCDLWGGTQATLSIKDVLTLIYPFWNWFACTYQTCLISLLNAAVEFSPKTSLLPFQTTVIDLLKSTKSLVDNPGGSNLSTIKRKLEDNERDIYGHMIQLHWSNIENGPCEKTTVVRVCWRVD